MQEKTRGNRFRSRDSLGALSSGGVTVRGHVTRAAAQNGADRNMARAEEKKEFKEKKTAEPGRSLI